MTATAGRPWSFAWGLGLPALRVVLVAVACVCAWVVVGLAAGWAPFPPTPLVATVAMLPVNIVCLALVLRQLHRERRSAGAVIGWRPQHLGRDILWGLLWLAVLSVPFMLTIAGVMWALHGPAVWDGFETVFFDEAAVATADPIVTLVLALIAVLTFAPLNAPTEELVYRGYAQRSLATRWPLALAIAVPSVLFGLQHAWYAPTPDAVLVYVCAFFVWGVGSGIIAWRQGRLFPLILAHGMVNLFTTLPVLIVPFLISNGAS